MTQNIAHIVEEQVARWRTEQNALSDRSAGPEFPRPVIAISRMLGAGAATIAHGVAKRLRCQIVGYTIVNEIAKRSDVREELVEALDERSRSQIKAWIDSVLHGQLFDEGDYHHYLLTTVRSLTRMGSVVVLGRGATFLPRDRPRLDVRVVAPMEDRITRLVRRDELTREQAYEAIKRSDTERTRFVKKLFGRGWDDPLEYDLVVNTGSIDLESAVSLVEGAWLRQVTRSESPRSSLTVEPETDGRWVGD